MEKRNKEGPKTGRINSGSNIPAAKECGRIYTSYDLRATLESGQTFAFTEIEGGFVGVADGHPASVYELGDGQFEIIARSGDIEFWRIYFDLGRTYENLLKDFIYGAGETAAGDGGGDGAESLNGGNYDKGWRFLTGCVNAYGGLRLLRQPVWETICEFIISANNNLKRIASIYRRISENMGEPVGWAGGTLYSFPSAKKLAAASEDGLRSMGLGYRAPYLLDTAGVIAKSGLPDLNGMPYRDAHKYLTGLRGVGEKVADCVLLFSTKRQNAFPVDVWIERALREQYGMAGSRHAIKLEAQSLFGEAAGLVQQFLFHGIRNEIIPKNKLL